MKNNILITLLSIAVLLIGVSLFKDSPINPLGGGIAVEANKVASSSVIAVLGTVGIDNTILMNVRSERLGLLVSNDCSSPVYLFFATTTDHLFSGELGQKAPNNNLSNGYRLIKDGGSLEIGFEGGLRYTGSITASSTADCDVFVAEF